MPQFSQLTDAELLLQWAETMEELRTRNLIRSANNPVADYAEQLVAGQFGLTLVGNSTASYDATGEDGTRYQIKARRLQPKNPNRQLSAIRNLDQAGFDQLIVVLFDQRFDVVEMWQLPLALVQDHARFRAHVNAHILHARGAVLQDPRAKRLI